MTAGPEEFLLEIIDPILKKCEFVLQSTKEFSDKFCDFQKICQKYNVEVTSYDAVSLYTNIDVKTVVTYIVEEIYKTYDSFFKRDYVDYKTEETIKLRKMPKNTLKNFVMKILTTFSTLSTLGGYYRQHNGISMESK